jgi:DNA-binding SARP family transcriptional activator
MSEDGVEDDFVDRSRGVTVRVQTFGACTVDVAGNRLGRNADILVTLLLVLIHAPGMQVPRDVLTGLLWPDAPDTRSRANLRQALYKLRQMGVRASMCGEQVELDAAQVERNFSVERNITRFDGDVLHGRDPFGMFLPHFQAEPNQGLVDWLENERERAHGDARRVLAAALNNRHALADWHGAQPLARWLLQFDPLNEAATMVMAECLVLSGAKYEATQLLDKYMKEIGPDATDLRIPVAKLRRRIAATTPGRISFAPSERHFIGREGVMSDLTLRMRRARFNDGSATLLHATAGMGKTRVIGELVKVAALEGTRDIRVGCRETDVSRPLSIFLEAVPELMKMSGALGCSPENLHALRRFTNTDSGPNERSASGVLDMPIAAGLRRSIVDLISAIAEERPLLFVVEDAHWLDAASWEVIVDLVDRIAESRVCLILTSRLAHARALPPSRTPLALKTQPLLPLSPESCLELAHAISVDLSAHFDEELGDWFVHTSEGVPLFLRSLVNHWIETGDAGGIPPTLLGIIGQRLHKLSADALCVLQTVALLDRHAELAMIEAVLELPCYRVVNALDDLHKAGAFDSEVEGRLVCHELIGRMAIDGLGRNARRALHKRIALILRARQEEEMSPVLYRDRLEHLLRSGDTKSFLSASGEAVRDLLNAGYSYDALGVAEGALLHASDGAARNAVLALQAEALYSCGEYARLLSHPLSPESVGQGLSKWHDAEPEALVRWLDSAFYADRGSNAADLGAAATLVSEEPRYSDSVRYSAATLALRIAGNTCDADIALRAYNAGLLACEHFIEPIDRLDELHVLYHTVFGDGYHANHSANRLLASARSMQNISNRLRVQLIVGLALRSHGDVQVAREVFQEIYALAIKENLASKGSFAAWRLSNIALDEDQLELATYWADEYERVALIDREPLSEMILHIQRARLAIYKGDAELADHHRAIASITMTEDGHLKRHASALAMSLAIARLRKDLPALTGILLTALDIFFLVRSHIAQDFFTSEVILALHALGRHDEAKKVLSEYSTGYRRELAPLSAALVAAGELISTKI